MKKTIIFVLIFVGVLLALTSTQPWQRKIKVLSVRIPKSNEIVELWEKPNIDFLSLSLEYATWLRIVFPNGSSKWNLIDKQYITFNKISIFISADNKLVRIESNGEQEESHMIAEYSLEKNIFSARSEKSVRNEANWYLLIEKLIR
jgi:hypothetical protein